MDVPGPVWVRRSFCSLRSIAGDPWPNVAGVALRVRIRPQRGKAKAAMSRTLSGRFDAGLAAELAQAVLAKCARDCGCSLRAITLSPARNWAGFGEMGNGRSR